MTPRTCGRCSAPAAPGRACCSDCNDRRNVRQRAARARRNAGIVTPKRTPHAWLSSCERPFLEKCEVGVALHKRCPNCGGVKLWPSEFIGQRGSAISACSKCSDGFAEKRRARVSA